MSSNLGKRKEREEEGDQAKHSSTLFVSNLPYTATSVDLQTLFSDIAPVRSAFVVTEHGTGVSKGVGYVSFSIREDAQAAYEKISKEGITLVGRSLRVEWAGSKPKDGKREKAKKEPGTTSQAQQPRPSQPRPPQDSVAIRTVVVSGLPDSVDSKTLWKKFRKSTGAEKVDWPAKADENQEASNGTAHILFDTPANAHDAVNKLHAHVFKGSLLSAALKKRLETLQKSSNTQKPGKRAKNGPSHSSRLIVRNIPFSTTEQDLRAVFLPYGPIHSIHIPMEKPKEEELEDGALEASTSSPKTPKAPRTRGFAFVWMLSRKDAERALEGCNGLHMYPGMAAGMVEDKQKKKKQRRLEKKMKTASTTEGDQQMDEEEDEKHEREGRTIAIDWALSKDKWEEEKSKMDIDGEEKDVETGDGSSDSESEADSDDSDDPDSDAVGLHEGDDEDGEATSDSDSDEERGEEDEDGPVKPELPPPETGTTLFVRNVPFSATEDDLRTLFRAFGPLRYARITIDPETGRSRGTGFACFWNKEDADKAIEQSELLKTETVGSTSKEAPKNPFTMPSILTPDPSSSLARSLVLHGRTLDVVRAVTRTEAGKLREEGEKRRQKADKRNMYLLREGVILPNTPAAENLAPADLERRTASFGARKNLLKSNPSLYVSKTRLSIRQIPLFVTEHMLKRLALHAVKAFNIEYKSGERKGLTADELDDFEPEPEQDAGADAKGKGKSKDRPHTGVKQTKIVRQQERVDPVTGKGRSKGYGFVEMYKHADALRVLRWANNNAKLGTLLEEWWKEELRELIKREKGKGKEEKSEDRLKRLQAEVDNVESNGVKQGKGTLIIEFSIENVQVVKRRATLQKERSQPEPKGNKSKEVGKLELDSPPQPPAKKRRVSGEKEANEKAKVEVPEPQKAGNSVGFLIGRKRKQRKAGKGH
ncbi:RNA recognition motif-containing protein [Marasmius sp. AFHP31]|nr:RNA recognition motif-containing protein [Marasmius sp. AFHP31]KAK1229204.1 RNA recognition motif-containing protein [Marasmius sp. AFHP31]